MPMIHIPRGNRRFGGTVSVGLNGRIFRIPVGVDYPASDEEVAALAAADIPTSVPTIPAGSIMIPSSFGTRIAAGLNGVIRYLLTGVSFVPTEADLAVLSDKQISYWVGAPAPTPTPTPTPTPVPGATATDFTSTGVTPTLHYHIPAGSTVATQTITAQPANVQAATSVSDLRGLAPATNGASTGPIVMTDGLGRKFLRFTNATGTGTNGDGPNGPNVLNIDSAFLPNNRNVSIFAMVRWHKSNGSLFVLGGSSAAANGMGVSAGNSGSSQFLKYGNRYSNAPLDGDTTKMVLGSQPQIVGYVGRTAAGVAGSANTGALLYVNGNRTRHLTPTNLTATAASTIGEAGAALGCDIYEYAAFTGQLTDAQADAVAAAMVANWSIPAVTDQLVLEGDSITAGILDATGSPGTGIISSASLSMLLTEPGAPLIPPTCRVTNQGISGDQIANLISRRDAAGSVFSAAGKLTGRNIVAVQIGRNHWDGTLQSATDVYNLLVGKGADATVGLIYNTANTGYLQRGWEVVQAINIANGAQEAVWQQQRTLLRAAAFLNDVQAGPGQTYDGKLSRLELPLISVGGVTPFNTAADTGIAGYYQGNSRTHPTRVGQVPIATGGDTPQYGYGAIL